MTNEEIQAMAKKNAEHSQQVTAQQAELKARWLDLPENYNIFDAITSGGNVIPLNVKSSIAPVGCHYRKNHVDYLVNSGYSTEEAIEFLSTQSQYTSPNLRIVVPNITELIAWGKKNGITLSDSSSTGTVTNTEAKDKASPQQIEQAKQQSKPGPSDVIVTSIKNKSAGTTLNEDDYVKWLCEVYNGVCRAARKPQIPTSICVSIALARTGFYTLNIGQFNFWMLPHDDSLTTLTSDNGKAAFESAEHGANACITVCHMSNFTTALIGLEDEMSKTTEENKQKTTKAILEKLSSATAEDEYKKAMEFVEKHKLREWDTDKTVAEGGHADQSTSKNSQTGKDGNGMQDIMAKAAERYASAVQEKGKGYDIVPAGTDHVRITKLPKGKTPCEPIYPDYIQVGDTIPEWVYSETYAKIAEAAEKKALEAAGIKTEDTKQERIAAFNNELNAFKEAQFAAWCKENGVKYSNETEKQAAEKKYDEAQKNNPNEFKDGIYIPDESSKNKYSALLEKRKTIVSENLATSAAYSNYQSNLQSVKQEITAREGNWNQDTGKEGSVFTGNGGLGIQTSSGGSGGSSGSSSGSSGGGGSATNANVEKMVEWALNTANDQSHGYSQTVRTGPDYDCSSFVYYALENAGFGVITKRGYAGNGDTLPEDLKAAGWKENMFNNSMVLSLKRGDIMWLDGHVAIYIGMGKTVEASGTWAGKAETGDQGNEIGMYEVVRNNKPYTKFFRYEASASSGGTANINAKIEAAVKWAESKVGGKYSQKESERNGPNSYDCSSFVYYALDAAGFGIIAAWQKNPVYQNTYHGNQKVGDADTIWTDIQTMGASGWKKYTYSEIKDNLQRGDIVAYWESKGNNGHTYIMTDSNNTVEAKGAAAGICKSTKRITYDVQEVYRYTG